MGRNIGYPLTGADHLTYLGVPLCYHSSTLGQLGISLARMSSSFFALRRLFDHPDTPVKEKLSLFQTYITSKWAWCAPVVYPSARALKSLEAFKHTLLLSLLRLQVDPLQPFLSNVVSRRRPIKVLCEVHSSQRWGRIWLERLWNFWGHVFRSQEGLPIHEILAKCSTRQAVMGRVPAGVLKPLIFRKLQREGSPVGSVESLAKDRENWSSCLPRWLQRWGYIGGVTEEMPENYLHDRQLLLIGDSLAILRPARVFPEEPYRRELQHIVQGRPTPGGWMLWCRLLDEGACITLIPPRVSGLHTVHIQAQCDGDLLARRVCFWDLVLAVWSWVPSTLDKEPNIFVPPQAFAGHFFCHQVPLADLWRVHRFDNQDVQHDLLAKVCLHPKAPQDWLLKHLACTFGPFASSHRYLIRLRDFSRAQYFSELPAAQPFVT